MILLPDYYGDPRIRDAVWANIHPEPNTGCWLWSAYHNDDGYGRGYPLAQGRLVMAHRITFEALVRPLVGDEELDHLCRVRPCCNPEHLEAVPHLENVLRATRLITECKYGHEYTTENTGIQVHSGGKTSRYCLACVPMYNAKQLASVQADPEKRERTNRLARESWARRKRQKEFELAA